MLRPLRIQYPNATRYIESDRQGVQYEPIQFGEQCGAKDERKDFHESRADLFILGRGYKWYWMILNL